MQAFGEFVSERGIDFDPFQEKLGTEQPNDNSSQHASHHPILDGILVKTYQPS